MNIVEAMKPAGQLSSVSSYFLNGFALQDSQIPRPDRLMSLYSLNGFALQDSQIPQPDSSVPYLILSFLNGYFSAFFRSTRLSSCNFEIQQMFADFAKFAISSEKFHENC